MKKRIHVLLFVILLKSITLNAQCQIDSIYVSYFNGITDRNQIIDIYKITNNSDEDYLTWISLTPVNNRTNLEMVRDYFKKRRGDWNLQELMFENLLDSTSTCVGYSFIKKILPGEIFSYIIAKNEASSNFYRKRIVLMKKNEVETYLRMEIDNIFYYQFTHILLEDTNVPQAISRLCKEKE